MTELPQALIQQIQYNSIYSPFYKKMLKECNIFHENIKSLADFRKIPFTDKDQLSQYNTDFLTVSMAEIVEIVSTSGTTGEPVPFYYTTKDIERLAYNEAQAMQIAGISAHDIVQLTTTSDKLFVAGLAYQLGIRKLGASLIRVGPLSPAQQWKYIQQFSPTVLIAVPSFILKMLHFAKENQIPHTHSSVQKIICIGEPIRYSDFSLNVLGQKIQSQWSHIQLLSTYASTEMSTAFTECTAGKGGHTLEDLIFIESIDEQGNPVPKGQSGELVITTLQNQAMPLMRFKTGDICVIHEEPCTCGRKSPRIGPIIGRKKQMIKYKGTTFYPFALKDILAKIPEIELYYIEVSSNELQTDQVKIYIHSTTQSIELQNIIKDVFQTHIRVSPEIQFESKEKIEAILALNFRKPNDVIDLRNTQ